MASPRTLARRVAVRVVIVLGIGVAVLIGGRVGLALWMQTMDPAMSFEDAYEFMGIATEAFVRCSVFDCELEMPGGLEPHVWADESILPGPVVAIATDEHGRVFVAEGDRFYGGAEDNRFRAFWLEDDLASRTTADRDAYYQKWIDEGEVEANLFTEHADRLTVLEDRDADGVADHRTVLGEFRERLDGILAGVLVRDGRAWVTNVPSLYVFDDRDGDGLPETRATLSTGYGVKTSLQGHDLHGLVEGPDGRIYFSLGDRGYHVTLPDGRVLEPPLGPGRGAVFRMQPDGTDLEVFATGLRNPQELAFDDFGHLFTGENNSDGGDDARIVYVVEGGDSGWAMPFQTLNGEYLRGPWNAEKIWRLHHEGQPAWIVPPVGHLARGPAGFAHYPGTGLPDRYAGHFFLADYRYQQALSKVWSFGVERLGAGFRVVDPQTFIGNLLATDIAFGTDGRIFVSAFDAVSGGQQILVAQHEDAAADPLVAEVKQLLAEGLGTRTSSELAALLAHADQRIRLRSQYALAGRGDPAPFTAALRDPAAPLLARIHAAWGLSQLGAAAVASAFGDDLSWAQDGPAPLRTQLLRVVGDAKVARFGADLVTALSDPGPRLRFFAAQSLGALGARDAVAPLYAMLEANADADPFLRHAGVYALHRIGDLDGALARADHPSRSVRLAVLLQLRRAERPEIERFLTDADPTLVVEAARAIYDVPIPEALPALAALSDSSKIPTDPDPQSSLALHRRIIGANRTLGSEAAAIRLARYATRTELPVSMRRLALDTLAEYVEPGPRDLAMSWHRPLAPRAPSVVFAALDQYGPALVDGDLGDRALEVASALGRVPLPDEGLLALVRGDDGGAARRVAALAALAARTPGPALDEAVAAALSSEDPALRAEARDVLAALRPDEALASLASVPNDAPLAERQAAWRTLATIDGEASRQRVRVALDQLQGGSLDPAVVLEVLEAARALGGPDLEQRVARIDAEQGAQPMAARAYALSGGDPEAGRRVFQSRGDCQRCHGSGGHGAGAGPELAGLSSRRDAEHVLQSVLDPQAEIAAGFATVSLVLSDGRVLGGTLVRETDFEVVLEREGVPITIPTNEIRERSPATSGMPPMGRTLSPRELRDLLAYVATL